jgi:hypothetical protein
MKKALSLLMIFSPVFILKTLLGFPTVYPTGTTIYVPTKCWNGFTIMPTRELKGAVLIDMNGNVVKNWKTLEGFPIKMFPGGFIMGGTHLTPGVPQSGLQELLQLDWEGNIIWKFDRADQLKYEDRIIWSARQNHDFQREGNPVGYFVPGMDPLVKKGKTLLITYQSGMRPEITNQYLIRHSGIIEVSWEGEILWRWMVADHFDELNYSEEAKNTIMRWGWKTQHCVFINTASWLGPNKWHESGDERFHPENIIVDDRGERIFILSRKTGKIVWMVGPDYSSTRSLRELDHIIGPHHAHMIPKGLPGAGNILVFDNGGAAGYGSPNPGAPTGEWHALREYSRVVEFDPITLKIVWQYTARTAGFEPFSEDTRFFSHYRSSAQRLPNGNTLITESDDGRLFEVTPDCEIVWEYISPYFRAKKNISSDNNIFRAYRVPYEWVPQVRKPAENAVIPPSNSEFRINPVDQ